MALQRHSATGEYTRECKEIKVPTCKQKYVKSARESENLVLWLVAFETPAL